MRKLLKYSGYLLGIGLTLFFCLFKVAQERGSEALSLLDTIENTLIDAKFVLFRGRPTAQERLEFQEKSHVVIVGVDEKSLRMPELGNWPWPRAKIAELIQRLNACDAKVIGFDMVFSEPDNSRIAPVVNSIIADYGKSSSQDPAFADKLKSTLEAVDGDQQMVKVMENADNVVLGQFFFLNREEIESLPEDDHNKVDVEIDAGTSTYEIPHPELDRMDYFPRMVGVRSNLPQILEQTEYLGFFNAIPDPDRIFRHAPLLMGYRGNLFPSLSLQVLSRFLEQKIVILIGLSAEGLSAGGEPKLEENHIELYLGPLGPPTPGHRRIPVGLGGYFRVNYYGGSKMFRHISAGDILRGDADACGWVANRVALVGATSLGIYDMRPNPFESSYPGVEIHATVVENVLRQDYLARPEKALRWEGAFLILVGLLLTWILNRYRLTWGLMMTFGMLVALFMIDYFLLFRNGILAHVVAPSMLIFSLFIAIAVFRYATEEREKSKVRHAFQHYLGEDVIETILQDPSKLKLGGERAELTVLFSDIRGFTTISEKLPPEKLTELLNEYLTPMTELVFQNEGTLDKYMGDAIMAFFGAPYHYPHHARAACHTALQMMTALDVLRQGWRARGLPELDIGIGLNTGPMSVGNMGSKNRFDYTVMGDHVNLGSRLEGTNKQFGTHIIISEFTHTQIQGEFTCRELDAVAVKGKHEPVRIFELLHLGSADSQADGWIEEFHRGLTLYKAREFSQALRLFEALQRARPVDAPTRLYVERCQEMIAHPPEADWDGVFRMKTK